MKKAQISFEYLILMSFVTLVISGILGIAVMYTGSIQDRVKINQANKFANKVVSTAEYVYYAGEPSKATITTYLPENINQIDFEENSLIIEMHTSNGERVVAFPANVNMTGSINPQTGVKKLEIVAYDDYVSITHA